MCGPKYAVEFFSGRPATDWNDISSIMLYLLFLEKIVVVLIPLGSSMLHAMPLLTRCMASNQIWKQLGSGKSP